MKHLAASCRRYSDATHGCEVAVRYYVASEDLDPWDTQSFGIRYF